MAVATRRALVVMAFASVGAPVGGCSTGPPTGNSGFVVASGACSGTPTSCLGLPGAICQLAVGCVDTGSCVGTAATTGVACGAQTSFAACSGTTGCFWQSNCTGQPIGTCSGITQEQCVSVPGCVWTSFFGSGGGAAICDGGICRM